MKKEGLIKTRGGGVDKERLYHMLVTYIIDNQDKFYRLAFSYLKNQDDALDAVQNAVCKALEHYGELRNEAALKTWVYRIVLNESLRLVKARKREILTDEDYQEQPYEEKAFDRDDDLYVQIDQMEEVTQKIIKLRFFEELTLGEIAQVLEMNVNTVKAKLYRGLKILKIEVEKERSYEAYGRSEARI